MFSDVILERYSISLYLLNPNILPEIAYEMQKENYGNLYAIWTRKVWDRNELNYICEKINRGVEYLKPSLFFGKEQGYIDHIKSCYLLCDL